MKILIKRVDRKLPTPTYDTMGSACFDLACRKNINIKPKNLYVYCSRSIEFN